MLLLVKILCVIIILNLRGFDFYCIVESHNGMKYNIVPDTTNEQPIYEIANLIYLHKNFLH